MTGVLKGYDQLLNLVLDEVEENLQTGMRTSYCHFERLTSPTESDADPQTRKLGLVVLRGPTITLLSPVDGFEEIANPFAQQE